MTVPKIQGSQRDFSAGELDVAMKRADENPLMKSGARQMSNWRILNSKAVQNRPGRRALQLASNRVDEITIAPGVVFRFNFTPAGGGTLNIFDTTGSLVFTQASLGFTLGNIALLTWAVLQNSVYIAGPGLQPLITTWSSGTTWSGVVGFNGIQTAGGQYRRFFYRITRHDVTMAPSALTGNITVQFSLNFLVAGHVGTLFRYIGRQVIITALNSASNANATVIEPLPGGQILTAAADPRNIFNVGDEIIGSVSGAKGYIIPSGLSATQIQVQLLSVQSTSVTTIVSQDAGAPTTTQISGFLATDIVVGPGGSVALTAAGGVGTPNAVPFWDEEVMNNLKGWPACVFSDQNRLGFANFPAVPNGIGWSTIGNASDMYVGGQSSNAMFELAPDKVQIYFVLAGPESGEFVFTDRKVFYIPISVTNPLTPGRVAFNVLSSDGAANVQPRAVEEIIFYATAGGRRVKAVIAPGAYYRPFRTDDVSENHDHVFNNIVALAAPTADGTFPERYCYALNGDGTLAVGKYQVKDGQLVGAVGWVPWSGAGTVNWISARDSQVLFTTTYSGVSVLEALDDTVYLDGTLTVNSIPTALAPPGGKGPLYVFPGPGATVTLMDQVTRMMGTYTVDANGFIIPKNNGGENLSLASLVAGQPWTATLEPFVPDAPPGGQDVHQRMMPRRVARFAVYVSSSTGFLMARLFAGPLRPGGPALGTIMNNRRFTTWNQDDDPTKPPPLREGAYRIRPLGRAYDPRVAIIKDTPGPLVIHECAMEATI